MLDSKQAAARARELLLVHEAERSAWQEISDYLRGIAGKPSLPAGANREIQEIARISIKNIMPVVVDTFTQALAVVGFRSPSSDTDLAVWGIWQRERMDARQSEVIRPTVSYGAGYIIITPRAKGGHDWRLRTVRQVVAHYADPAQDEWPIDALEVWVVGNGDKAVTYGVLYDATHSYAITFPKSGTSGTPEVGDSKPHGMGVCPVVRLLNDRDAEQPVRGEVAPLIPDQKAINAVNFDRLVVSRFGAFPQKYIMGWAPPASDADPSGTLQRMAADRILAIDQDGTTAGAFPSASVTAYNEILEEMIIHAALKARINVSALTGDISNVGAETIALVDAPNQRKLAAKQRSLGESFEQALRLAGRAEGIEVPDDAEVVWGDTEPRSFAQVVDGLSKLVAAGVPITSVVDQIPGLSQQKRDQLVDDIRRAESTGVAAQIIAAARAPQPVEPTAA